MAAPVFPDSPDSPIPAPAGTGPRVNLDAGGNSRLREIGRKAYAQALEDGWADPRRLHFEGRRAAALLSGARETCAAILGTTTSEVHFASSLAVAAEHAITGILRGRRRVGDTVVTSAIERAIILNALTHSGARVHTLGVDQLGRLDPALLAAAVGAPQVALTVLAQGNHEVGTLSPLAAATAAAQGARVPLLLDAAASIGQVPVPTGWDGLLASPADWGGGPGIAILALRARTRWQRTWPEDQDPWFPGGVSVPAAVAAAVTLEAAERDRVAHAQFAAWATERIAQTVQTIGDCEVIGDRADRLPGVLTFSCLYVDGEALTTELDRQGFAVGSGSACTSLTLEPSHVLGAMGVLTHGNIRVVVDHDVTRTQIEQFCAALPPAVAAVRSAMGVDGL